MKNISKKFLIKSKSCKIAWNNWFPIIQKNYQLKSPSQGRMARKSKEEGKKNDKFTWTNDERHN